jgi:glycosyltransferase involved in cell wall biosynthesis
MSPGVNLSRDVVAAGAGWACGEELPLADVLRRAMRDANGRMRASQAARAFAARFSWHDAGRALADQYTRIVYVPAVAIS